MQHLQVSGAVRHIYIYVIRRLKVNHLFLNMFRASLRPSSGGQTAFSLHMVICPVVTVVMLGESAGKLCALCGVGCLHLVGLTFIY